MEGVIYARQLYPINFSNYLVVNRHSEATFKLHIKNSNHKIYHVPHTKGQPKEQFRVQLN